MSERLLPEVLDFFEHRHREDAKSSANRLIFMSVLLAINTLIIGLSWEVSTGLSFLFLGIMTGFWLYGLIDFLSARRLLAAYLRYEYEIKALANIPEEKE